LTLLPSQGVTIVEIMKGRIHDADQSCDASFLEYFADLPDPRIDRGKDHASIDIITIAILATICGAEFFTEMEAFGKAKQGWLSSFLELGNGIPSHDTFARVFARISPGAFRERFTQWVQAVRIKTENEVVGIDGKTARRSLHKGAGGGPLHLVSAWAARNRLVLGQVKVGEKSNEITAVPELLRLLDLTGCIVTVDALNTQKEIAREIREQGADYVMALKDNHPTLSSEVKGVFEAVREDDRTAGSISATASVETNHGRTETRRCWSVEAPDWLTGFDQWRDLQSLILVEATREIKEQQTTELRYYLSSLPPNAERAGQAVRQHWGIENSLHWILDVAFNEDDSRVRVGNAPENLALVRKITHNLLQQEETLKRGVKTKRLMAAWNEAYLQKVLNLNPSGS
jgi:predicted transposase YbfD/YdcC